MAIGVHVYSDGMHQSWKQGNPLSNTIKDTMRKPELCREGLRMIVLVSLIVLLRDFLVKLAYYSHVENIIFYCKQTQKYTSM